MSLETATPPIGVEGDDPESEKTEVDNAKEGMKGGGGGDSQPREKAQKKKSTPSSSAPLMKWEGPSNPAKNLCKKRQVEEDDLFFRKKIRTNPNEGASVRTKGLGEDGGCNDIPNLYGPGLPFTHCKIVLSLTDDKGKSSSGKFKKGWKRQNGEFVYYDGVTLQEKEMMNRKIEKAKRGESSSETESGSKSSSDSDSSHKDDNDDSDDTDDEETEKLHSDSEDDDADTDSGNSKDKKKTRDSDSDWDESRESSSDSDHENRLVKDESGDDDDGESSSEEDMNGEINDVADERTRKDSDYDQGGSQMTSVISKGSPNCNWSDESTDTDLKPLLTDEDKNSSLPQNDSEDDGESEAELKPEILYKCPFCFLIYPVAEKLIEHLEIHNTSTEDSKGSTSLNADISTGRRTGSEESESLTCSICGKTLAHIHSKRIHMRIHNDERPYSCRECGKTFRHEGNLQVHTRIHTNEKPFKCHKCDRAFTQQDHLKKHMPLHDHSRPWRCSICNFYFQTNGALKHHETTKHDGGRKSGWFPCPFHFCKTMFPKQQNIYKHIIAEHGKGNQTKHKSNDLRKFPLPYSQPQDALAKLPPCMVVLTRCDKLTQLQIKSYKLDKGMTTKSQAVTCQICFKTLARRETLIAHMRIHTNERPYGCPQCAQSFRSQTSLQKHEKLHDPSRPLKCGNRRCGLHFLTKSSLNRHHFTTHRNKNKKRFKCDHCDAAHRNYRDLHIHMMFHDSTRPWKCPQCSLYFLTEHGLQVHYTRIHYTAMKKKKKKTAKVSTNKKLANFRPYKRYSDLEKSFRLLKIDNGRRTPIADNDMPTEENHKVPSGIIGDMNLEDAQITPNEPLSQMQTELIHPLPDIIAKNDEMKVEIDQEAKLLATEESKFDKSEDEDFVLPIGIEKGSRNRVEGKQKTTSSTATTPTIEGSKTSTDNANLDISSNKKPIFCCTICSKILSSQRTLNNHILAHESNKPYNCPKCPKSFCVRTSLKRHILVQHEGVRNYECPTCNKRFANSTHLKLHSYLHSGEKPYACSKCSKGFLQQSNLNSHIRAHEEEALQ